MAKKLATFLIGIFILAPGAFGKSYAVSTSDVTNWGIHDDGLLWLKVWNNGAVGDTQGSGIYPAPDGPANIYAGYFLAGATVNKKIYVSGSFSFGIGRPGEWRGLTPVIMSRDPEWKQVPPYIKREGTLDSYYRMTDSDAGENGPIPVTCDVHGISSCLEDYDDFIAFRYHLENGPSAKLEETYLALAYDFDVGGSLSYIDDYVGFDDERKMPYMYDNDPSHPYLGLVCLDGPVRGAHSWDIDADPDTERYLYAYMAKPTFDCEQTKPNDWRVMLSAGPFEIPRGVTEIVTFAVVAGADLDALLENADAARSALQPGPPPEPSLPKAFNLAQNLPNPVTTQTTIRFTCRVSARLKLSVYDLAGRCVTTLADRIYQPGTYEVEWRPRGAAPGVYLYTLEAPGGRFVKTMVVAR